MTHPVQLVHCQAEPAHYLKPHPAVIDTPVSPSHRQQGHQQVEGTTLGGGAGAVHAGKGGGLLLALQALGRLSRSQQLVHGHAAPQLRTQFVCLQTCMRVAQDPYAWLMINAVSYQAMTLVKTKALSNDRTP